MEEVNGWVRAAEQHQAHAIFPTIISRGQDPRSLMYPTVRDNDTKDPER